MEIGENLKNLVGELPKKGVKMQEEKPVTALPPTEELEKMPWDELIKLRHQTKDEELQKQLAPYEHRAYAREDIEANPERALIYPMLIPGYQAAKAVGLGGGARTEPSLEQLQQGFIGMYEGLRNRFQGK